jgi:hypothetical protein
MDNKKFEKLIDLIINENEEQARALFHDIVVEKSREIYESMMDEELEEGAEEGEEALEESEEELEEGFDGMEEGQDEVGGLLDEIDAEEQGMTEEEDEFADIDMDDSMDGEEAPEGGLEDRVVELEDKLDELMAEFEEMMGSDEGAEDMGGEEEFGGDEMGGEEEPSDEMMEAVQLQKVSVTHGDNGVQTKSTVSGGPKIPGNGAKAVAMGSGDGGKGGTQGGLLNPAVKDIPGNYKNAPGKGNFSEKGEAAPKPAKGDDGQNSKSIVGESKKTVKKIVK